MRRISIKYILFYSIICGIIASCSFKEDMLLPDSGKKDSPTLVIASVENFSNHNVTTKASDEDERKISDMAMLIFGRIPQEGDQVNVNDTTRVLITTPIFTEGGSINFVINTTESESGQYISDINGAQQNSFKDTEVDLSTCKLYLVANMGDKLYTEAENGGFTPKFETEAQFLNICHNIVNNTGLNAERISIDIPDRGFPMIGCQDINLNPGEFGSGSEKSITVSMKKLFAKINVKFLVKLNSENVPEDMDQIKTPYFKPTSWSVHNIPARITLRDSSSCHKPRETVFNTNTFSDFNFSTEKSMSNQYIENDPSGKEYFDFTFYIPEHKVLPRRTRTSLPGDIEPHLMQCHKPTFCDTNIADEENNENYQYPTYVKIKGKYSDHQGHISDVEYSLYLGQNEIDDFQIYRNQQLNNIAVITGLTNYIHTGENNISIDHRVDVESKGYSIAMERETLLDSHFEIRPMDISVQEGAVVVVKIPKNEDNTPVYTWFSAEEHNSNNTGNNYDPKKPGLRKFFTMNLVEELNTKLKEQTNAYEFHFFGPEVDENDETLESANHRIWFYFDENTSTPYDASIANSETNRLYREGTIKVDYYANNAAYTNKTPTNADREFTFRQMNLWAINSIETSARKYSIEYFEEYLYNYASDDQYGVTSDGMKWGLQKQQLSTTYPAMIATDQNTGGVLDFLFGWLFGGGMDDFFNTALQGIEAKYDFYITRDGISSPRDYSGLNFTREIVNESGIYEKVLTLSGDDENNSDEETCEGPESAIEYCYNKNKRNANGRVETIHWYLPAIDETEEILVDGFNYFPVFQSKYYWSSQPSYHKYDFSATNYIIGIPTDMTRGYFYSDNINNARATIVTASSNSEDSGTNNTIGSIRIRIDNFTSVTIPDGLVKYDVVESVQPGNQSRDAINRVRCAYNKDGISAYYTPISKIFATYSVSTDSSTEPFSVTISYENETDTPGVHNVELSNYLHHNYHSSNYPQAATYDENTGILTIEMGQRIGRQNIYSKLENSDGPLQLQYHRMTQSFTVIGNVGISETSRAATVCHIESFTKTNQE